jgi:hypothetical protein
MDFVDETNILQAGFWTEGEKWEAEEAYNDYQLRRAQEAYNDYQLRRAQEATETVDRISVQRLYGEKQNLKEQGTALLQKWHVHCSMIILPDRRVANLARRYEAQKREHQAREVLQCHISGFLEDLRVFVKSHQLQDVVAVDEMKHILFGSSFGDNDDEDDDDDDDDEDSDHDDSGDSGEDDCGSETKAHGMQPPHHPLP